ncbi:hypothetical protein [Arthrobacter sp. IK3]|uniref:hypothetical protein n=1 Tax=Arthrobacter sp. IK3 TaxID=3448169 RepID=UPI003EDFE49B
MTKNSDSGYERDDFIRFLGESLAELDVPVDDRVREAVLDARRKLADLEAARYVRAAREKPKGLGQKLIAEMADRGHSPSLSEFREMEAADSNIFWRLESGDHQNLLDEAMEEIDGLHEALRRVTPVRGRNGLTNAAALMRAARAATSGDLPFNADRGELASWLKSRALWCLNPNTDMDSLLTITSRREIDDLPYGTAVFTGDNRLAMNLPADPARNTGRPEWVDCLTGRRLVNFSTPVRVIPSYEEDR